MVSMVTIKRLELKCGLGLHRRQQAMNAARVPAPRETNLEHSELPR
jgi:hypothetical protein